MRTWIRTQLMPFAVIALLLTLILSTSIASANTSESDSLSENGTCYKLVRTTPLEEGVRPEEVPNTLCLDAPPEAVEITERFEISFFRHQKLLDRVSYFFSHVSESISCRPTHTDMICKTTRRPRFLPTDPASSRGRELWFYSGFQLGGFSYGNVSFGVYRQK